MIFNIVSAQLYLIAYRNYAIAFICIDRRSFVRTLKLRPSRLLLLPEQPIEEVLLLIVDACGISRTAFIPGAENALKQLFQGAWYMSGIAVHVDLMIGKPIE